MKTLYLMRHAKAGWGKGASTDIERPLTAHGEKDAARIGRQLQILQMMPQIILTSTAERTRATAEIILPYVRNAPLHSSKSLYLASEHTLLKIINNLQDQYETAMLIGHNPGISVLIGDLSGEHSINLATSAFAEITCPVDQWAAVAGGIGIIKRMLNPYS